MTSLPTYQLAYLTSATATIRTKLPVPTPGPNEVLIANAAVAANPKDWKVPHWSYAPNEGYVEGSDVAGIIAAVGEGVTEFVVGQRVAAFPKMLAFENKWGAYQEYTVAPAATTFPIPDKVSFEQASTIPLAGMTGALGLFVKLGIPAPGRAEVASNAGKAIILNGASTSVGAFTIQLAKRAGLYVVGVAGATKALALELGADVVVDYREHKDEASLIRAIVAATGGRPTPWAYDAISEGGSALMLAKALAELNKDNQAKVTVLMPTPDAEKKQFPSTVTDVLTYVGTSYTEDEEFAAPFYRHMSKWLADEKEPFIPNRVKIMPNGLDDVAEGLALLLNKKVHGEKLVYRIKDTTSLKPKA
ncbi:chaperonin 10-like protein [Schizophyllum commune]